MLKLEDKILMRRELAELIGKTVHNRMVGVGMTEGSYDYENVIDLDIVFATMSAYDILDAFERNGWKIVKIA